MITYEDIEYLARTSQLEVSEEELPSTAAEIERMLLFTAAVGEGAAQLEQSADANAYISTTPLRSDEAGECLAQSELLGQSDSSQEGFFCAREGGV